MGLLDGQTQRAYYTGSDFGTYQFITLDNIISAFTIAYVGEDKIISKVPRTEVQFHAMRAIQELSYDVFKSIKSQEIEVPNTLKMILPQDYINYVKLVRVGSDGIERVLYPTGKTSNPFAIKQTADGTYDFDTGEDEDTDGDGVADSDVLSNDLIEQTPSNTWSSYQDQTETQITDATDCLLYTSPSPRDS